jgi:hypothetical protein
MRGFRGGWPDQWKLEGAACGGGGGGGGVRRPATQIVGGPTTIILIGLSLFLRFSKTILPD